MDYLVVSTLKLKLLYVLIIINHATRKIEHFAVTSNPNFALIRVCISKKFLPIIYSFNITL